jgi:signal transduction histidine kinase
MTVALTTPRRRGAIHLDARSRLRDDVHDRIAPLLDRDGLAGALETLARHFGRGPGPLVHLDADAVDPLPPQVAEAGYDIALEAVSHATHHAGAGRIDVRLRRGAATLELTVADDGRGLVASRGGGVGLASMHRRAARLGGILVIESSAGGGTRLYAELPIEGSPR